jgi:NAD(P)-dependent dehydrogenase (short-subunit alcohol dehydrogenase family)
MKLARRAVMDGVALITGASRGIGASIAERFAAAGLRVAITARTAAEGDHRLEGSLATTAERIRSAGGTAITITADLAKQADRQRIVETVERELGPIDVLVNNAAVTYFEPVIEFP